MPKSPVLFAALFLAGPTPQFAATYTVKGDFEQLRLHVTVKLDAGTSASEFRMPAWAPGDYRIVNFGKGVRDIKFLHLESEVPHTRPGVNVWTSAQKFDTVTYSVVDADAVFFSDFLRVTDQEFCFDGPAVLGYVVGHANEKHTLRIAKTLAGGVECALERVDSPDARFVVYTASDYDTLIDNPVIHSNRLRVLSFTVLGKPHKIIGFNQSARANLEAYRAICESIILAASRMFSGLPYPRYYFLMDFGGGGGGLEHLTSTRLGISPNAPAESYIGLISHEFFHVWNVKRIRPKVLGPFDYTKPAITGDLWWLEGVTEYYAKVIAYRSGLWDRSEFLRSVSASVRELSGVQARLRISADESSRRVWEANNSMGYGGLNYYLKGDVIGLCLDLAIRAESDGKHSLDDVVRALWQECRDGKPGYSESRIRELCVQFGGQELGSLYDECVMTPGEVPVGRYLSRLGLAWGSRGIESDPTASESVRELGMRWPLG